MLSHPIAKAIAVAFFCGSFAFAATWARQRRVAPAERARHPDGLTPLNAGLMAMVGALLGIAVAQMWPS